MAQPRTPEGWGPLADPPWDVRVTIVRTPQRRAVSDRIASMSRAARMRVVVAMVLLLGAVGSVVLNATGGGTTRGASLAPAAPGVVAGATGQPAVAAIYRYPLGCLGASLSSGERSFARNQSADPCWRYGVYVTAILSRVRGTWQLALEAVSPSCPPVSLPAPVRAQLAVCRQVPRAAG
jgi:hypothetical protein